MLPKNGKIGNHNKSDCKYCLAETVGKSGFCASCNKRNFHSTWFKRLLNPILRKIGLHIVSLFDDNDKLVGFQLRTTQSCKVFTCPEN